MDRHQGLEWAKIRAKLEANNTGYYFARFVSLWLQRFSGIMLLHIAESSMWAAFYCTANCSRTSRPLFIFAGELHGDRLWRCGTAAKLAAIGCDSGRFRSFALRTFHCLHLRGYERDVQSKMGQQHRDDSRWNSPDTVRSNSYFNTYVTIGSRPQT